MKQIDDVTYNLVSLEGFMAEFWRELVRRRRENPRTSQEIVFEDLNAKFENEFGEPRFKSYDAFRKTRDKRTRNKSR